MKEFLEAVEKNEELKNKILALKGDPEAIEKAIAIAKEYGFEISEETMAAERNARFGREISEDELNAVNGGDGCFCVVGGGGTGDGEYTSGNRTFDELTCACVVGGGGEYYYHDEKYCRCVCVLKGVGECADDSYEQNN